MLVQFRSVMTKLKLFFLLLLILLRRPSCIWYILGSGHLSWADEEQTRKVDIKRGDLYTINPGFVFYVHNNLEPERQKLRFYAIFANTDEDQYEPSIGAYSRISDMITGFNGKILQAAFKVPEEMVEEMTNATSPPPIVHAAPPKETTTSWEWEARFEKAFLSGRWKMAAGNSPCNLHPRRFRDFKEEWFAKA